MTGFEVIARCSGLSGNETERPHGSVKVGFGEVLRRAKQRVGGGTQRLGWVWRACGLRGGRSNAPKG